MMNEDDMRRLHRLLVEYQQTKPKEGTEYASAQVVLLDLTGLLLAEISKDYHRPR